MKVKTNLSSFELELVSKGIGQLAKQGQADGKFIPENEAESGLLSLASSVLDEVLDSLNGGIKELFDE